MHFQDKSSCCIWLWPPAGCLFNNTGLLSYIIWPVYLTYNDSSSWVWQNQKITIWIYFFFLKRKLVILNQKDTCYNSGSIVFNSAVYQSLASTDLSLALLNNCIWSAICIIWRIQRWWSECKLHFGYIVLNHCDSINFFLYIVCR